MVREEALEVGVEELEWWLCVAREEEQEALEAVEENGHRGVEEGEAVGRGERPQTESGHVKVVGHLQH